MITPYITESEYFQKIVQETIALVNSNHQEGTSAALQFWY
jgi:hypothetical protein